MRVRVALSVAILVLSGCSTLPHPFRPPTDAQSNPLAAAGGENAGVRIPIVDGPPIPMARLLSESVAAELGRLNVPAAVGAPDAHRYVLNGRTEINKDRPDLPYIVLTHWMLLDRDGRMLGRHTQGVEGTWVEWEYGDARIIGEVGRGVARNAARLIRGGDDEIAARRESAPRGLWIRSVEGAPGDGNRALARAMRAALAAAAVPLAKRPELARFHLQGSVTLSPTPSGEEKVRIVWAVAEADGRSLGKTVQDNAVPTGSLDGSWGQIAALAAEAAVDGIGDIVDRASDRPPRVATARETLEIPTSVAKRSSASPGAAGNGIDPATLPPPPAGLKRAPGKLGPPE